MNNQSLQILSTAFDSFIDYHLLETLQQERELTRREQIEQSIAAIKLLIFGSASFGLALDYVINHPAA